MALQKIESNQWRVAQDGLPAYFLHKLTKGRVGIYELSKTTIIDLEIQEAFSREVSELLFAVKGLYERIINDPECRDQNT